jgi:hypothetical protein
MAVTAAQSTMPRSPLPGISPAIREMLALERKRLKSDPLANPAPADLTVSNTFIFRSKPGSHRMIVHNLPMPPDEGQYATDAKYQFAKRTYIRLVAKKAYPELSGPEAFAKIAERMLDLQERIGDTRIFFVRVARHCECFYPTDDPVVAAYVRELIEAKVEPFNKVHEVSGKARVIVGEEAFPDTTLGWTMARQYAAEHEIADIKLVKE